MWRLAFEDHCELCDDVQRRHGNADEADDGPLALRARKVETTVGGLGKTLEERLLEKLSCDAVEPDQLAQLHDTYG